MSKYHVTPNNDKREHIANGDPCPCLPREREGAVIHNSYDGREVGEVCRLALRSCAKAESQWSIEDYDAYSHAFWLLQMHWPEK